MNRRRGLTLMEMIVALTITAMVGSAIAAMLHSISVGVETKHDNRAIMLMANAANARISSYVASSNCILATNNEAVVLWLEDSRQGGTVHATEIRWIAYDAASETLNVYFVKFPDAWSRVARDLADLTYPKNSDWFAVLNHYDSGGYIHGVTLATDVASIESVTDKVAAIDSTHITVDIGFNAPSGVFTVQTAGTIRLHREPSV